MILKTRIIAAVFFSFAVSMPSNGAENPLHMEIPCGKKDQTKTYDGYGGVSRHVASLVFDQQGKQLVVITQDEDSESLHGGSMKAWDTSKQKKLIVPPLAEHKIIYRACFNQIGTQLVSNSGKKVYVYDFATQQQKSLFTHEKTITAMCFAGQSNLVLGDMYDQVVMIDKDGRIVACSQGSSDSINDRIKAMCYNEKTSCLATVNYNNTVSIYDKNLEIQNLFSSSRYENKEDKDLHKICYDDKGDYVLIVDDEQKVFLIDTKKGKMSLVDKSDSSSLLGMYFDTKDQSFKLLLWDEESYTNEIQISAYDIKTKESNCLAHVESDFKPHSAIVDPSGTYLAIAGENLGELFVRLYAYKQFTAQ